MRILLIEHDNELIEMVKPEMDRHFVVDVIHNGYDGTYLSQVNDYAAIVIESSLPDTDGINVCKKARDAGIYSPVVMLSDRNDLDYKINTLESGVDALISKPVNLRELLATLKILIRRSTALSSSTVLAACDLVLDIDKRLVIRKGKLIKLRKKEFSILELLLLRKNKIVLREQILEHIWEEGSAIASNTLDVHIKTLRDKVDKPYKKKLIKTMHGFGYTIQA